MSSHLLFTFPPPTTNTPRPTGATDLAAHHGLQRLFAVASHSAQRIASSASVMDRTYLGYAKDLPGKNSCLSDKTLKDLLLRGVADNALAIRPFDKDVLQAAFTMQPGPVPGKKKRRHEEDGTGGGGGDSKKKKSKKHHHHHDPHALTAALPTVPAIPAMKPDHEDEEGEIDIL
ncbi:hypothetical protein HDU98_006805 [Podochytrium sp. JEL0797]|nr:hypothetical protein HDU98_006805 [Podochytrium sp. JEL0797]